MRDVVQIVSMLICVGMLVVIRRRVQHYQESAVQWYAFTFIAILTLLYYVGVFVDLYLRDFWNGSDVSSMVRLASLIALTLYLIYAPHRLRKL